jgi:hypothetical protein
VPMANTLGIAATSLTNSIGTSIYTGGQTGIGVSVGVASYDFKTGDVGYLGKSGNSALQNIGYGFGALANIQDVVAGFDGTTNYTRAEHGDGILHARSWGYDKEGQGYDISVAHYGMPRGTYKCVTDDDCSGFVDNLDYSRVWAFHNAQGTYYDKVDDAFEAKIYNVNSKIMDNMYDNIRHADNLGGKGDLMYGYPWGGCYGQVARALFRAGVLTFPFYGFTPQGLVAQLWLRQAGIWASPYLINK